MAIPRLHTHICVYIIYTYTQPRIPSRYTRTEATSHIRLGEITRKVFENLILNKVNCSMKHMQWSKVAIICSLLSNDLLLI